MIVFAVFGPLYLTNHHGTNSSLRCFFSFQSPWSPDKTQPSEEPSQCTSVNEDDFVEFVSCDKPLYVVCAINKFDAAKKKELARKKWKAPRRLIGDPWILPPEKPPKPEGSTYRMNEFI